MAEFAGSLGERVVIEHWVASDAAGVWRPGGKVAASVAPEGGGAVDGEARRSRRRWRVVLRAGVEVGLASRLWWRGVELRVLAVEDDPALPDRRVVRAEERP